MAAPMAGSTNCYSLLFRALANTCSPYPPPLLYKVCIEWLTMHLKLQKPRWFTYCTSRRIMLLTKADYHSLNPSTVTNTLILSRRSHQRLWVNFCVWRASLTNVNDYARLFSKSKANAQSLKTSFHIETKTELGSYEFPLARVGVFVRAAQWMIGDAHLSVWKWHYWEYCLSEGTLLIVSSGTWDLAGRCNQ